MVEFALVAPLLFLILVVTIDFARLVYTYGVVTSAAREGARTLSLKAEQASDCLAIQRIQGVAQGFILSQDPSSQYGDTNPNQPQPPLQPNTPPPGQGYFYIWPSVSTPSGGCNGRSRPACASAQISTTECDVAVQVEYTYLPLIPVFTEFTGTSFTLKAISIVHTEY